MTIKPYLITLITCVLVMVIVVQPHAGFMLYLVAIPLTIWAFLSIAAIFRKRDQLKPRAVKLALWIVMIVIVLAAHWHYYVDARQIANHYARVIEQYKFGHGAYPSNLQVAGLDNALAHRMMLGYVLDHGKPGLFYSATFEPFDVYFYDFDHHAWVYQPD